MARFTAPYSTFIQGLREIDCLQKPARRLERTDPIRNASEIRALCRSSIVLLSSQLESYIKSLGSLFLERLVEKSVDRSRLPARFFYYVSKYAIDEIRGTNDPEKIGEKVMAFVSNDSDHWSPLGVFPRDIDAEVFNSGFSSPSFRKICKYLNRFGYSDFKADLKVKVTSSTAYLYRSDIDNLVNIRNKIAHGDMIAMMPPSDCVRTSNSVLAFCRTTDALFSAWCSGTHSCTLR